jgi:hypothetical protein
MQVWTDMNTRRSIQLKEQFEIGERDFDDDEDMKRFFKHSQESTFEESRAAARKMREIGKRQTKHNQKFMLFHSLYLLIRSDSEMLSWPNSPLLVMLHFVDPNVMSGNEPEPLQEGVSGQTPLHDLADLADPSDYSTHENQLILTKQLIEHGADVNAVSSPNGRTLLHMACSWYNVTNLDFVELLLKEGADPNAQDHLGLTPLMCTTKLAPGAAKFLMSWSTTDVNINSRSGESFLVRVFRTVKYFSDKLARLDNPDQVQHHFLLQQWCDVGEILVERDARYRDHRD